MSLFTMTLISLIDLLSIIFVKNSPSSRLKFKMLRESFRVSKNSFRIQNSSNLKIILRKLQLNYRRVKNNSISCLPHNCKTKVRSGEVYFIGCYRQRKWKISLLIGWKYPTLRHLKSANSRIVNFKSKLIVCQSLEMKNQLFDYFTFGFDVVVLSSSIVQP